MAEKDSAQQFCEKYGATDKIWSGHSFAEYPNLRELLEELPVSEVPEPIKEYPCRFSGILDNVYGELLYTLLEYEGYFKDKAYHIDRCTLKPVIRPHNAIIAFNIDYTTKNGEPGSQSFEIIRNDPRNYIFFTEKYRTS
ncbi:MAG: hypothetical protein QME75_15015 [Deltaproteobacteria bacterium]|nr:hypothetical protein [Deltaproteobacteria bacterium]